MKNTAVFLPFSLGNKLENLTLTPISFVSSHSPASHNLWLDGGADFENVSTRFESSRVLSIFVRGRSRNSVMISEPLRQHRGGTRLSRKREQTLFGRDGPGRGVWNQGSLFTVNERRMPVESQSGGA